MLYNENNFVSLSVSVIKRGNICSAHWFCTHAITIWILFALLNEKEFKRVERKTEVPVYHNFKNINTE